ncbi:ROK family protein [Tissierella creatinophila]|uniref:Beta-glucoside kinase n=1 Tax=Tissierella creatinophila DSM 6911 TaxID=1123403 RepID=A0A1U7M6I2_TISCR|nr:ROK family protein [Tissierella creatinophila]OLS02819.1 beta-glucoside kinase [Tissierella creatinophila DSM 6911]
MRKVIGIDLGGTSIYGGVINEQGEILRRGHRETFSASSKMDVLNRISEVIEELLEEGILGIGVGSPGFIDSKDGKVLEVGGNIKDWANTNIREGINKRFPRLPVFVENDANVAAICERWIGVAKDLKNFIMITLGTGVGGAIYLEKEGILKGQGYQAAELGHTILYPFGEKCNCGQNGCVERYISGTAIERIYKEKSGEYKKGIDIFKDIDDKIAIEVIEEFINNLGVFLVSLKNIFDPDGIIIGGGVINSREYWWNGMIKSYKKLSNNPNTMKILPAVYLNDAGMIGAAKSVFSSLEV